MLQERRYGRYSGNLRPAYKAENQSKVEGIENIRENAAESQPTEHDHKMIPIYLTYLHEESLQ